MCFRRALLLAAATVLIGAACSSPHKGPQAPPAASSIHETDVRLHVTGDELVSPLHERRQLDAHTRDAVVAAVQQYLDASVVQPLTRGTAGPIDKVFTWKASVQATFSDHAALFADGLPKVSDLETVKSDVQLTGLTDEHDHPALVVAKFDWDVRGDRGVVHVMRSGELSLVPVLGTWLVGAYNIANAQAVNGGAVTTTTAVAR